MVVTPVAPGPASVALADLCLRPSGPRATVAITVSGLATLVLEVCGNRKYSLTMLPSHQAE